MFNLIMPVPNRAALVTASETFKADILIDGNRISSIAEKIDYPDAEIIDATGKMILSTGLPRQGARKNGTSLFVSRSVKLSEQDEGFQV